MKKVYLGMLLLALGFGTMSLTPGSDNIVKASTNNQKVLVGPTYIAPWLGNCCESPLTAVERDLVARGLPPSGYIILSTTSNSVTYKIN